MSLNRQMRRRETREKMREWVRDGTAERVRKLSQGGITVADYEAAHKKGYEEGYMYASSAFLKKIYAAMAKELQEAGNERDDIYCFIRSVDQRFAVMFDADEEVEDVLDQIGVRINLKTDGISTLEVVK